MYEVIYKGGLKNKFNKVRSFVFFIEITQINYALQESLKADLHILNFFFSIVVIVIYTKPQLMLSDTISKQLTPILYFYHNNFLSDASGAWRNKKYLDSPPLRLRNQNAVTGVTMPTSTSLRKLKVIDSVKKVTITIF